MSSDVVGHWEVPLSDGVHRVEFEHGTITGKRIIRVDGKNVLVRDKMFKLVGTERFTIGKTPCCIFIDASDGLTYEYTLEVNGKSLEKFIENQAQKLRAWNVTMPDKSFYRVILDKESMEVYVDGKKVESAGEFDDEADGTRTHFELGPSGHKAYIKAVSSGRRRDGIIHTLVVNNMLVSDAAASAADAETPTSSSSS